MEHKHDYLVIGAGMAADATARAIREVGPDADIGIVGEETSAP